MPRKKLYFDLMATLKELRNEGQKINKYDDALQFAKMVADDARKISSQYYKTDLKFVTKSDTSPVTIADEKINQMVINRVKEHFPEHGVLGEEKSWQTDKEYLWVCDPIDGTIAFSMGDPTFMFSLALVENGKPVVAVAGDLANGGIFWATKDGGAYFEGKPIHVSSRKMSEAWLAFPTGLKWLFSRQAMYERLAKEAYQTNIIHGGVFKGVLIAQGLSDGTIWPETIQPWDMAAVKLIVEEAGGRLTNAKGLDHLFNEELTGGVIISNGVIHEDLLGIVNNS